MTPCTLSPQVAAHHARQAFADCQPEAGAAILARGGRICLAEGLEQATHPIGRDADAGIADGEVQLEFGGGFRILTLTTTSPFSVNFTALLNKLIRIWRRRVTSPRMAGGTSFSMI